MEKHVIFLGAGASHSSGYPLADKLRERMGSWNAVRQNLPHDGNVNPDDEKRLQDFGDDFAKVITLFREGGFGSVDEFCKMAATGYAKKTAVSLKHLMRICLCCLHNPENDYLKSDYYPFVQKLFNPDSPGLRGDVTVMSFNYDPYLEFILHRAYLQRQAVCNNRSGIGDQDNAIQGGFLTPETNTLEKFEGFVLLKLHGTVAYPTPTISGRINHQHFFETKSFSGVRLAGHLIHALRVSHSIPTFFPWEILNEEGSLKPEPKDAQGEEKMLKNLCIRTWIRAQKEVQQATKVSFVGLSMHPYLSPGFTFLFKNKTNPIEVVVANEAHKDFRALYEVSEVHSATPAGKVFGILKSVLEHNLSIKRRGAVHTDISKIYSHRSTGDGADAIVRRRQSFQDFILHEL